MKLINNLLSIVLNRANVPESHSLLRIKTENMRELIERGDVDAIKQILKKEVLFKAYLLINKYIQSDILLLDLNTYPRTELQFVYEENQQRYSIIIGSSKASSNYEQVPVISGLYKIKQNFDHKRMTIDYSDRISINDDKDQEIFWVSLVSYVKETQKKLIDEKHNLIEKENAIREAKEKEEKRLRLIELKKQEAERVKKIEQHYFS